MASDGSGLPAPRSANTWPNALTLLYFEVRRLFVPVLAFVIVLSIAAAGIRLVMPRSYEATAEMLIDPRGLQVFENELVNGQYDANASVNYVESQIHVVLSTPVLTRALHYVRGESAAPNGVDEPVPAATIEALRRNVGVSRAERSYLVSVTASAETPEEAAALANAIVRAYIEIDAASQSEVANRVTGSLSSRLAQLRANLAASEEQVEDYRRKNNLVSTDDQLIVDQQLTAAVKALGEANSHLSDMRVQHDQLLAANLGTIATLASPEDQTRLNALFERQVAAKQEYARLSTQLGARHPSLQLASGQISEIERLLQAEFTRITNSSATALTRAEQEKNRAEDIVATLTEQSTAARQSSIELRTLQEQVRSDQALLASFETRSREMGEFARLDAANIRQISPAYAPEQSLGLRNVILWGIGGAFLAGLLGAAFAVLRVILRMLPGLLPAAPEITPPQRDVSHKAETGPLVPNRYPPIRPARIKIPSWR